MWAVINALRIARVVGLAARATRLITADTITKPARAAVHHRILFQPEQRAALALGEPVPPPSSQARAKARAWAAELLTCRWCMGVWVSTAVVATERAWGHTRLWRAIADTALAAYAVGWLAEHESPAEHHHHHPTEQ